MRWQFRFCRMVLAFVILSLASYCLGQSSQEAAVPASLGSTTEVQKTPGQQAPDPTPGSITGTVLDQSGAVVAGARVTLTRQAQSAEGQSKEVQSQGKQAPGQEVRSGSDGQFSFAGIAPGSFQLSITSEGFATQTFSGILQPGENDVVPPIKLDVAEAVTEVQVGLTRQEVELVAEEQIKAEEKQRVLGIVPNFYASYIPNAAPLTPKQKFQLAGRLMIDPFTLVVVAGTAGLEQAQNHYFQYGQGAQGYAKRFGANYADTAIGTFIGNALLPSVMKQDPRYFYKGTGSTGSRIAYAISMSVIRKGDNGRWQPNYSGILGSLAAGGISNLYYPSNDRDSAAITFDNTAIGIGASAVGNLFQEFVVRKFTPKLPHRDPAQP